MTVHNLVEILQIDEASLRKAVGRLRDATNHQLAVDQGIVLEADGFIQNSPRFGYRLNPLLKEVSALADLDD